MPYSKNPRRSGAKRNPLGTRPGGTTKPEHRPVQAQGAGDKGPAPPPETYDGPENPARPPARGVIVAQGV